MDDIKKKRSQREANNEALGIKVDVDFQAMVEEQQENVQYMQPVSHSLLKVIMLLTLPFPRLLSTSQQTS